jgi:predicted lipoprotein with Yx(FWY)xxD motif
VTGRAGISLLAALALVAGGAEAASTLKLKATFNETLGTRIVVTPKGRTLYLLRGERDGRFLCTSGACLATWPPLILKKGVKPVGVARLGVVKRPDGRRQATYKRHPLYRFAADYAKGDVGGEGFVDVGTWHAARAPKR